MAIKVIKYPVVSYGTGPDSVALAISENAWANGDKTSDANGDASFTVSVNGVQQGGTYTVLAPQGSDQTFSFAGTFGVNPTVTVTFINDASGGTSSTDRNLYVDSVSYEGASQSKSAALYSNGPATFKLQGGSYPVVSYGIGPDTVALKVSENAWANGDKISDAKGDAEFTVSVNGVQQGGTYTVLASQGTDQTFSFAGTFGVNPTVIVTFINDASGGTSSTDRNLYVDSISYEGASQSKSAALYSNGPATFKLQGGSLGGATAGTSSPSFYVSATGDDSWSGTAASSNSAGTDGPFKTLARAEKAMEQSSTIKTTNIEAGTYSIISQPLTFSSQDSGESWNAYQNGTVAIDGGGTGYVSANGVNNLTIKGLTFQNLGVGPNGAGLYLSGSGETIQGNTFLNSNSSAISGAGLTNSVISNNTVNGVTPGNSSTGNDLGAMEFWYGSSGNKITHNLIENTQGGGINFSAGPTDPANNNNIIDSNKLINVETSTFDNGAIYIGDRTHQATGNQITNNVIDGNGNGQNNDETKGIYLDDMTSNVLVSGNVLYGNAGEYGIQFHGGDHNTVQNNIFSLSSGETLGLYQDDPTWSEYGMMANDFKNNIVYYTGTVPASQWQWAQSASPMATLLDTGNLYYSATGKAISNSGQVADSNPYNANPQFQSPASGNFSMPSTSPAYADIAWQTLSINQGPAA